MAKRPIGRPKRPVEPKTLEDKLEKPPARTQASDTGSGQKQEPPADLVATGPDPKGGQGTGRETPGTGARDADASGGSIPSVTTPGGSLRDQATVSAIDDRPGFDQGFGAGATREEVAAAAEASGLGGNPLTTLTGGSVVGGPLADSAGRSGAPSGPGSQGTGLISQGVTTGGAAFVDGEVRGGGTSVADAARSGEFGSVGQELARVGDVISSGNLTTGGQMSQVLAEIDGKAPASAPADAGTAPAPAGGGITTTTTPAGNPKIIRPDGSSTTTTKDGKTIDKKADGTTTVTEADGRTTTVHPDGTVTETAPTQPAAGGGVSIPDPDGVDRELAQQLRDNPAIAAQLAQARSGGSGDIDPVDDDTAFGVGAGAVVPDQQEALLGNPGVPGGLREGGVPQGPNFNGDLGAIDPGPDAVFTGGGRQEDPGDIFGDQPSLAVDLSVPSSSDDEDDTADDGAADDTSDPEA